MSSAAWSQIVYTSINYIIYIIICVCSKARERALNRSHKDTVMKQKDLQEELSLARIQYEKLLGNIAREEKQMRDEK